ncbi:MAG: PP2C family protein-serine/threonine phosphatase [Vampirovibrionales bacterium]
MSWIVLYTDPSHAFCHWPHPWERIHWNGQIETLKKLLQPQGTQKEALTGVITGWNASEAMHALRHELPQLAWVVWEELSTERCETGFPPDDVWVDSSLPLNAAQQLTWAAQRAYERHHTHEQLQQLQIQWQQSQDETARRNHAVETDLYLARQLQQSLLPKPLPDPTPTPLDLAFCFSKVPFHNSALTLRGLYIPSDALGGDLYDVVTYPDGSVGWLVADVSGHGIKAGFITAILKALYQQAARHHSSPADILNLLNNQLAGIINTGDYITGVAMHAAPQTNGSVTLTYSGAGHPYPIHVKPNAPTPSRLQEGSAPLVWFPDMVYTNHQLTLNTGEGVLIFTDGVTELRNQAGDLYGEERLEEEIHRLYQQGFNPLPDYLLQILSDFSEGYPLPDDLSVLWLTVH